MTNTPPPAEPIVINPLWITLALPIVRMVILATSSATAATAQNQAEQIVSALVTLATAAWGLWSWWKAHQKQRELNSSPAGAAIVK